MAGAEQDAQYQAVLVFSAPVVKELVSNQVRLPPNYVGVRRIRPSSFEVRNEFRGSVGVNVPKPEVVYKVIDESGNERRMNTQEKKKLKLKLRQERAEERKKRKKDADENRSVVNNETAPSRSLLLASHEASSTSKKSYHQLEISKTALEEELADLRGDRDGVPPVMLSPPLAKQAFQSGALPSSGSPCEQQFAFLDDDLASRWAEALKTSLKSAEEVRSKEDLRPMPYQLAPEVWSRLRPPSLVAREQSCKQRKEEVDYTVEGANVTSDLNGVWSFAAIRPRLCQIDSDTDVVVSALHRHSNLHLSCGAKFGCDFLIYDGSRDQRHAFAGLRIIERTSASRLPLPSSYVLTGYVRCLNTAGKLALLATVERADSCTHVAIVDLALEKIAVQSKRKKSRRNVGNNLAKH